MIEKRDFVILGGGVAGLCAAKRLLELGLQPLVIEAGGYPAHKVCGEFISPSGVAILKRWDIQPVAIHEAHFHTLSHVLTFPFPQLAGALSHHTLDAQLAYQIVHQGAHLFTHTAVQRLIPSLCPAKGHILQLFSGDQIVAKHLFVAIGRLPGFAQVAPRIKYRGFKAHFAGIELGAALHMFSFPGAYLGLVPVENGWANLACLAKIKHVQNQPSSLFMQSLINSHPHLQKRLDSAHLLFDEWMQADVSGFGLKSFPTWPRTYWLGDAAGTIPPASGNGLSLAIASGYLAAEFAALDDAKGFAAAWKRRCFSQILFAKGLHHVFLSPRLGNAAICLGQHFPFLTQKIFSLTRDPGVEHFV